MKLGTLKLLLEQAEQEHGADAEVEIFTNEKWDNNILMDYATDFNNKTKIQLY